jgi:hypothetical protein
MQNYEFVECMPFESDATFCRACLDVLAIALDKPIAGCSLEVRDKATYDKRQWNNVPSNPTHLNASCWQKCVLQ